MGERNRNRLPQSWQGWPRPRKAFRSDRGRISIVTFGSKRLRSTFQNCVWGKRSCQKICQRAMVRRSAPKSWESSRNSPRGGPLPHGRDQDDHGAEIDLPAEEPYRWRCRPLPAIVAIATEAEPLAVFLREMIAASGLAGVLGRVQPAAARARFLAETVGEVLVDRKKKRPEAGVAKQIMVQDTVLRVAGNIQEYTPREPRSSDQAPRGEFFENLSKLAQEPPNIPKKPRRTLKVPGRS